MRRAHKKMVYEFITLRIADVHREREEAFHAGTLAALDVVYMHDQQVIAAEIVNATDHRALLKWAIKDVYHNLGQLKRTIRDQNRRLRRPSTSSK